MEKVKYYMNLPYTTIIEPVNDESGLYYVGRIMEFDGCMSDGDTQEEALQNLQEAMELWIETKLANGFEVPEPIKENKGNQLLELIKRKGIPNVTLPADENGYAYIDKEKHPDLYDWAENG